MELVRHILITSAGASTSLDDIEFTSDTFDIATVRYHIALMQQRGYLDANITRAWGGDIISAGVDGLTWDGQDFYEALADERIWRKARDLIAKTVGTTTFDVIRETLKHVAITLIKSQTI
jgi:hypothetical protein